MPRISTDNYDTVASWNGSQDLFVVEQPDGTKVATPAQVKQYVLGDMDEVPTQNSNDTVKSGGVFSAVDDVYSVMGQMGAKNLIPYPFPSDSYSQRGIEFTALSDGTINANGTNDGTGNSTYNFVSFTLSKGSYVINGCPTQTGTNYRCGVVRSSDSATLASDFGSGAKFTLDADTVVRIFVQVYSGKTANNIIFKPMLRLAADTDNTYEPYAMTNKQLTEEIGDLSQTGLTGDSVAEQLDAARVEIAKKRSLTVSSSIIGNAVNVASATSESPYTTPHEGFVRFDGVNTCLCVNTYRMMKSSANADYKGMWLPKGVSIYFADATPNLAQWFNCSNE